MNLEIEAYEGELKELRKLRSLVRHEVLAERLGDRYFICGQGGSLDKNGLPDRIWICPTYGASWFQVYEKTSQTGK